MTPHSTNARTSDRGAESRGGLRRSLGPVVLTLITAAMIIDSGIFASLGMAMSRAGSGILVAIILGGFVALGTGLGAA